MEIPFFPKFFGTALKSVPVETVPAGAVATALYCEGIFNLIPRCHCECMYPSVHEYVHAPGCTLGY